MAKSMRSKVKRTFRRVKREEGGSDYAINEAARLARLSAKLRAKFDHTVVVGEEGEKKNDVDGDVPITEEGLSLSFPATLSFLESFGRNGGEGIDDDDDRFALLGLVDPDNVCLMDKAAGPAFPFLAFLSPELLAA